MNIQCPTCQTFPKLAVQWSPGVNTPGALIELNCGHAFELIPRPEFDQ